jgi:hypothetical protein
MVQARAQANVSQCKIRNGAAVRRTFQLDR